MPRAVLALDLGTRMGWALARPDGLIEHGFYSLGLDGHESDGHRFLRLRAWLHDIKGRVDLINLDPQHHGLELIIYERVDFIVPGQTYSAHVWGAFWGTLTAWAAHHGIPCEGIAPSTLKKLATGNGRADKRQVKAAVSARIGRPIYDHNEADALALLLFCMAALARKDEAA